MNKPFLFPCGALLLAIICLSIAYNYRGETTTTANNFVKMAPLQTHAEFDWTAVLSNHPQFKPEERHIIVTEPTVKRGIENSTLIGVVPDAPLVAIVFLEKNNEVLRIRLGEKLLKDWVLINVSPDHVVWKNENTHEKYLQRLFINEKGKESLLSSAVIN